MDEVRIPVIVDENRRLVIDLPAEVPIGPGEVVFRSLENGLAVDHQVEEYNAEREQLKAKLRAAGLLSEVRYAPPDAVPLSDEERDRIGRLLAGNRDSSEIISEDRGPY